MSHRQFHTLPGLLDSRAALPNSYPNALRAMQGGSLYYIYDGLWYDPGREANSWPTVWEADTLTTKPTRHSNKIYEVNKYIINKSAKWHCGRHTLICKNKTN